MKKVVLQGITWIVTFLISLFVVSSLMNHGNTDMTVEMGRATLPLVYMSQGEEQINCLHGYVQEMKGSAMRDTITPLGAGRTLSLTIQKLGSAVKKLSFEVRSVDGQRLVEATDLTDYQEDKEQITAAFTVKDLIEDNTEYNLILLLEDKDGRTIRYYTRIIQAEEYHVKEKLDFVKDFHDRTYDKKAAESLTKYLESNSEGDNSTYSHVDIHSSFQQITWGELAVTEETKPVYFIKELGPSIANIKADYMVSTGQGKEKVYYNVEEYYRIRYTQERMYLLDYQRDMDQIFMQKAPELFVNNKIMLGIGNPDVEMAESDGGNVLAFVNENRLYSYNISDNKFAYLFGFYDEDNADARTLYDAHGIKILNVDEMENICFLVYGYMNRGRHEGEAGIQVYYYNSLLNTIEEEVFIPDTRSYEMIKADVEQLAYVDNDNHLYIMLSGSVYEVNLESKNYQIIIEDLKEDSYKISESNRMIVWKSGERDGGSELTLLNLSTKKQTLLKQGNGILLSPLGFMGEDLIYGMTRMSEIEKDKSGKIVIPMYEIRIQNENDEILKQYKQDGIYVVGAEIKDNQISLDRVEKNEETMQYVPASADQIMNNEELELGDNTVELAVTEEYETVVQIAVKKTIDKKGIKFLTPKEVLFEGGREVAITPKETDTVHYYVYGIRDIEGVYTDAGNAVTHASEYAGVVINDNGAYVWKPGDRSVKNQIMRIKGESVDEERNSLAVCLDTILAYEGVPRNTAYMLERGTTAVEILQNNLPDAQVLELSGCSLSSVLYYVNQDIPVLALCSDGNAVLIVGFNELNTVLMDPLTGEVFKKGMNDSTQWFEENGNSFITYIRES
ncbi:MAG: hypothetical protein J6C33_11810 [Lachnospiraceae bacterium]|nr:hypothetical protein [Lachnospiraceae bacterium]